MNTNDLPPAAKLAALIDARIDDLRQAELDEYANAFEKWADRIEKSDVMNRYEASRGWHAAIDYLSGIHNQEVGKLESDVAELQRENKRLWNLLQCGQA